MAKKQVNNQKIRKAKNMLNIDMFRNEILKDCEDRECKLFKLRSCPGELCDVNKDRYGHCDSCLCESIEWLFREHVPVKITQEEKSYIRHIVNPIKNKANYICKTNNSIKIFEEKASEPLVMFLVTDELSFSEWEENKVYTIKELYLW